MNFRTDSTRLKPLSLFSQSSLTDIILLLLIFFLLTSSFVTNFGIRVNIPKAEAGSLSEPTQITVVVDDRSNFYVNGELTPRASLPQSIREASLENPGAVLVIRADRNATVDEAVAVMNIGKALDLGIVIATERE